jgi:hypothetical protein
MSLHSKLRWRAKLQESTARETSHLIAMVLNMHLDHEASCDSSMVLINTVIYTNRLMQSNLAMYGNSVMHSNAVTTNHQISHPMVPIYPIPTPKQRANAAQEPSIQVVLHWQRFSKQRCQVEILSSSEGPFLDPWSFAIANRLKQILD